MKELNKSFIKLVHILRDGHYHDGTTLGKQLNMTRSAVWKVIKKMQKYQINIDSVQGKGYALLEPFILLDKNKIKKKLDTKHPIVLQIFERTTSTNDYLKTISNQSISHVHI